MNNDQFPPQLLENIRTAQHIAVITGAGISAESKIPTFRDAMTGLWAQYNPEELATPEAFARDPKLVWDWYRWRHDLVANAEPNPGHRALVTLATKVPTFTLITQNVDSLHQKAGSKDVIELHGNISRVVCSRDGATVSDWQERDKEPPACPRCGAYLRPDVVWFGESLPTNALHEAQSAANTCDLFLSIGTSAVVQPAASLIYSAMRRGKVTVEINPDNTPQSLQVTHQLKGPSGEILPKLLKAAWS